MDHDDVAAAAWGVTALVATLTIALVVRAGGTSQWRSDAFELSFLRRVVSRTLRALATVEVAAAALIWFATPLGSGWAAAWVTLAAAVSVVLAGAAPDEPSLTAQRAIEHEKYMLELYASPMKVWASRVFAASPAPAWPTAPLAVTSRVWSVRIAWGWALVWRGALWSAVFTGVFGSIGAWAAPGWWSMATFLKLWLFGVMWWSVMVPYIASVAAIHRRDSYRWLGIVMTAVICLLAMAWILLSAPEEVRGASGWAPLIVSAVVMGVGSVGAPLVLVLWPVSRTGQWMAWVLWATVWPIRVIRWRRTQTARRTARKRLAAAEKARAEDSRIVTAALDAAAAEPAGSVGGPRDTTADKNDWRGAGYL